MRQNEFENVPKGGSRVAADGWSLLVSHVIGGSLYHRIIWRNPIALLSVEKNEAKLQPNECPEPSRIIQNHLEIRKILNHQGVTLFIGLTESPELKQLDDIQLLHLNYKKYNFFQIGGLY